MYIFAFTWMLTVVFDKHVTYIALKSKELGEGMNLPKQWKQNRNSHELLGCMRAGLEWEDQMKRDKGGTGKIKGHLKSV